MGKDSDIKYDPEQYKNVVPNWYLPEERKSIYLPIDYEVGMNYTRNEWSSIGRNSRRKSERDVVCSE